MQQAYTHTSSLEVGVPDVKKIEKVLKWPIKKMSVSGNFRAGTQMFPLGPWKTKIKGLRIRIVCMQIPPWILDPIVSRYLENM